MTEMPSNIEDDQQRIAKLVALIRRARTAIAAPTDRLARGRS